MGVARYPKAIWRPLTPENVGQPQMVPRLAIVHSAAVRVGSLYDYFMRDGVGVESHGFTRYDGSTEQYVDTGQTADASYKANPFAVSLETQDEGDPDTRPWTDLQVAGIVGWLDWVCTEHNIPRRLANAWNGDGIGYHAQFPQWSKYRGKTCPGAVRIEQFHNLVLPAVTSPSGAVAAAAANSYKDVFTVDSRGLTAVDPTTGGVWHAEPSGAVYATHGAPYLGGYNAWPEWGAGSHPRLCTGIHAVDDGYALVFDDLSVYRFGRDGRLVR